MRLARFYPILDTESAARRCLGLAEAAGAILDAGARMLQVRHKGAFTREVFEECERVFALCQDAGALFVMNDRADLARLLGSALHIGQSDLPPVDARRLLGEPAPIGYSTHNEVQLRAAGAEPVDYIALGPVFETSSKANPDPVVGLAEFARLRLLTARPVVAIGGITLENAPAVFRAGAGAIAVIGGLWPENGGVEALRERVVEWLKLSS